MVVPRESLSAAAAAAAAEADAGSGSEDGADAVGGEGAAAPPAAAPPQTPLLEGPLLALPAARAQAAKAALQAAGLFGWDRKVGPLVPGVLGVPLAGDAPSVLAAAAAASEGGGEGAALALVRELMRGCGARVCRGALPLFAAPFDAPAGRRGPHENDGGAAAVARASAALTGAVAGWLAEDGAGGGAAAALCAPGGEGGRGFPSRVEWLSDLLVLPSGSFTSGGWRAVLGGGAPGAREGHVWASLAASFRALRVARGARVDPGGMRASHLLLLRAPSPAAGAYALPPPGAPPADAFSPPPPGAAPDCGAGGWVRVKEGGLTYTFDATRLMFSSGNVTEKARMGALPARGETVVDLFAGMGYFTLPLLVRARAAHVHAAEWNPDAVACLRLNVRAAGGDAERRCTVWPGDNAALAGAPALRGAAHRVLLGLIPSSERAWGTALHLLRPEGGMLHVHQNAPDGGAHAFWEGALRPALQRLAGEHEELRARGWAFTLAHCERVKSYAPRVAHYVFDVRVGEKT
jgi:hypothetical protein